MGLGPFNIVFSCSVCCAPLQALSLPKEQPMTTIHDMPVDFTALPQPQL